VILPENSRHRLEYEYAQFKKIEGVKSPLEVVRPISPD